MRSRCSLSRNDDGPQRHVERLLRHLERSREIPQREAVLSFRAAGEESPGKEQNIQ